MSLTTYTELKAAVADWLARSDLTGVVPDLITLAEARMKRKLRRTSFRTTLTISAVETSAPSDMAELRSIYLETSSPSMDLPLRIGTPDMVAERRAHAAAVSGRPDTAALAAGKIIVAPPPDQSYTARIVYFLQLTPLSVSVASNTVLSEAPDAYLYGALLHAEGYLEHDDRIATWERKFDQALEELNIVRENEEHGAANRGVRLPRVFG